ncbi:hypothetical protein SSX86_030159 [Deinandra increscens subsp. villosa]|uniref:NB-ARC domain-containing protein n=1 Tax=Deinandra increscens subsp. villosa TaxID=3103831 RepID=A0AAP0C7K8_9ASTR
MEYNIKLITSWLRDGSSQTVDVLTIFGVGGIGKTSLANYVYKLHHREFTCCSFVRDISGKPDEPSKGLLNLQEKLYSDISKRKSTRVYDVSEYTSKIGEKLASEKVLLVLDDICSHEQLDVFLSGNQGFSQGSKIIVTTKNASLTEQCALFNLQIQPMHTKILLEGLRDCESLELLCIHAFKCHKPEEGYKEVSEEVVKYCGGLPLALKVLGSSLNKRDVAYWKNCIKQLGKEPNFKVQKVLKMSFDSLPTKNDKDLFKHIASFFVGRDRYLTETILNACDINTTCGFINLIERCLLRITWDNMLTMHSLIQEMGRDVVRQESPNKPWKRSRLWCHEESFKVLKQKVGTKNVLGLALNMRVLEKEKLHGSLELETDALSNMNNLMLLQLNYVKINGPYENISKELRWLCMRGFYLKSIPSDLPMENLVVLDMSHSKIQSFAMSYPSSQRFAKRQKRLVGSSSKHKCLLGSLKILDLSFCKQLHSLGGFFELPALEKLIISNCISLIQIDEFIERCVELFFLDLSNCKKLEKLPRSLRKLKKMNTLLIDGCGLGVFPTELRAMDSLQTLTAKNNGRNLETSCSADKSFSMDFSSLSVLKKLYLDRNPITIMPACVSSLPRLEFLGMDRCEKLKTVAQPPRTLRRLSLSFSNRVTSILFHPETSELSLTLHSLCMRNSSFEIEGVIKIQPLADIEEKHNLWRERDAKLD